MNKNFEVADRLKYVPAPVYDPEPGFVELYYKAWELAAQHVRRLAGLPQEIYMDEAFSPTQIWIWDSCFMALFCKYAPDVFPGVETLHNFYDVLYGNGSFPEILVPAGEPVAADQVPGTMSRFRMHIADNPPLFAWAEYENALFTGDTEHLHTLLVEEQYLQKHYFWLENLKTPFRSPAVTTTTFWRAHGCGYSWEGGHSGMDNTPRGRSGSSSSVARPATADLLWLDALAQQALSAECIGKLSGLIGDAEQEREWLARAAEKARLLREKYWDPADRIFYDISLADGSFCRVPTIASFWPMAAGAATPEQAERLAALLDEPDWFGGVLPFVTLARKDGDFRPQGGRYWRGAVWVPTAYMTSFGLLRYGKHDEARRHVRTLLRDMYETLRGVEPHTIWECYDPERPLPALNEYNERVRKDFCGWSALAPVTMLIECVIGINRVDAFRNRVCWSLDRSLPGQVGVKNLRFKDTTLSLVAHDGVCEVETDHPFTLEINGVEYAVGSGRRTVVLP